MKTKIKSFLSVQKLLAAAGLVTLVVFSIFQTAIAQEFIHGYGSDAVLQRGMVVRLKPDDATKVIPLKASEIDDMHGIVVDANDAPATLSTDTEKTFIATNGKYDVLVSTQNGEIKAGDYLTISATDGIAMKASARETVVVGKALADFTGKQNSLSTSSASGVQVQIGRVLSDITIAANPLYRPDSSQVPAFFQNVAELVSDKTVSPLRLYMAMAIFLVTSLIAGAVLYSGVRGGLVAIGRNPLSRQRLTRGMIQVIFTGVIIFACGLFAVYLLVKL